MNFQEAIDSISNLHLNNTIKLKLYGLYKTATVGICNTKRPSLFEFKERAKWDAWKQNDGISSEQSKQYYIQLVGEILGNESTVLQSDDNREGGYGVKVSSMPKPDEIGHPESIIDFIIQGHIQEVERLLSTDTNLISLTDNDGLSLLHWAVDREHSETVKLLINSGIQINHTDLEGNSALHYAYIVSNPYIAQLLIDNGIDKHIKNHSHQIASDLLEEHEKDCKEWTNL